MIYTVTLNPAIDHAVFLQPEGNSLENNKVTTKEAAGKGINVSRVLQTLGVKSVACAVVGGENGQFIQDELAKQEIPMIVQTMVGNTRENIKIIHTEGPVKEKNQKGPDYDPKLVHRLLDDVFSKAKNGDIIVLSGSIPQGLPANIYQDIISDCHNRGLSVCLDTSGPALRSGIAAKPDIIKPNKEEMEQLAGRSLPTLENIIEYGKILLNKGIKEVIITLGKDGLLYVSAKSVIQVPPLAVNVINTVGAGDSFVAGFVAMRDQGEPIDVCLSYATAVATASVTQPTTVLTDTSKIKTYQDLVTLQYHSI